MCNIIQNVIEVISHDDENVITIEVILILVTFFRESLMSNYKCAIVSYHSHESTEK